MILSADQVWNKLVKWPAKEAMRLVLGVERFGAFTFRRSPALGRSWGGAMNGQRFRCLLVAELIQKLAPLAIVETGTYLGMTTEWLASFQLPTFSCEAMQDNYGFAAARLAATPNVHLVRRDSRSAIAAFLDGPLKQHLHEPMLFYLDAHWFDDLPLDDEVQMIFAECPQAIVLIDDFKVPGDSGYGYDDYGPGKSLDAAYLSQAIAQFNLAIRYPSVASSKETGAKRGCAVVTGPALELVVSRVELLAPVGRAGP